MEIIKYEDKYKEAIEAICIATASDKARTSKTHHDFTLAMYCDEYLENEYVLLVKEDNEIKGYVLCATDYNKFEKSFAPYKESIESLGESYKERVTNEIKHYEIFKDEYPAHLHIDLVESMTSKGTGTKLIQRLLSDLKDMHVKGIMLGVSKENTRAIHFYKKNGFTILEEDEHSALMGQRLI